MSEYLKNRLRRWRAANGLTLEEVADLTGFSAAMLSRAERGERTFSPLAKVRIARALGVRVADLFDVEEPADDAREPATVP
jgi:transcriptional regulator with XRE-family HTH domain